VDVSVNCFRVRVFTEMCRAFVPLRATLDSNFHIALFVVVVVAVVELVRRFRPAEVETEKQGNLQNSRAATINVPTGFFGDGHILLTWCNSPRLPSRRGRARRCARSSACRMERRGSGRWARGSTSSGFQTPSDGSAPGTAATCTQ